MFNKENPNNYPEKFAEYVDAFCVRLQKWTVIEKGEPYAIIGPTRIAGVYEVEIRGGMYLVSRSDINTEAL